MESPLDRLHALGLELPVPPKAIASYVPTHVVPIGDDRVLVMVSGQIGVTDGKPAAVGVVPTDVDVAAARENARLCALNLLAQIHSAVGLDNVVQVLQLSAFVRSADGFDQQPSVINGASDLLVEILGDAGKHTRAAVGVNALPLGVPVELAATVLARR